ncbi:MAG TPA: beta-ketoacyl reductase, partial [Streptosporangiaceae bacterium]
AAARQAAGLPGQSLAWGLWADPTGLTSHLSHADRARMGRGGVSALTAAQGLALLGAATTRDEALLIPARLDLTALTHASHDTPPLWQALAPRHSPAASPAVASPDQAENLRQRLAALAAAEQDALLLDLVRAHVAAVLGHSNGRAIEPSRALTELGFDSLTAVELRNRLHTATGLRLPATLVFDYPAPDVLARQLREQLAPETASPGAAPAGLSDDDLRQAVATIPLHRLREAGLLDTLLQLAGLDGAAAPAAQPATPDAIDSLDAESLVRLVLDPEGTEN